MGTQVPTVSKEVPRLEIPEDVAVLYAWADLRDAGYRDFSAARRESRAHARKRGAQARREAEELALAKAEAEAAAMEAAASNALNTARLHEAQALQALGQGRPAQRDVEQAACERALLEAEELGRQAKEARADAALRAEAARAAEQAADREQREAEEARAALEREAHDRDAELHGGRLILQGTSKVEPRQDSGSAQPPQVPAQPGGYTPLSSDDMRPERFPSRRQPVVPALREHTDADLDAEFGMRGDVKVPNQGSDDRAPASSNGEPITAPELAAEGADVPETAGESALAAFGQRASDLRRTLILEPQISQEGVLPAWIDEGPREPGLPHRRDPAPRRVVEASVVANTLQHSRERVASRWFALRGAFDPEVPAMEPMLARERASESPMLAVFSLVGGAGKTSMTAALGRSLSAAGERVLLADATLNSILPFYFGATELRPGVLRTFSPRPGSTDAPLSLLSHELHPGTEEVDRGERLAEVLRRAGDRFDHVIADLNPAADRILQRLIHSGSMILVPVAPDMNAVISLGTTERFFNGLAERAGASAVRVRYVLNQFEPTLPLHLDVREVMRERLGDRLLPFTVRRSSAVAEALAEGMTVIDYAPEEGVANDYRNLATWFRTVSQPSREGVQGVARRET